MNSMPVEGERDDWHALFVRTDYSDDAAWAEVLAASAEPWMDDDDVDTPSVVHVVEGPAWDGVDAAYVLSQIADDTLSAVFIADKAAMVADHHAVLAVSTATRADFETDEEYRYEVENERPFRITPSQAMNLHTQLTLANMDFEEFCSAAAQDPEGVFRGF